MTRHLVPVDDGYFEDGTPLPEDPDWVPPQGDGSSHGMVGWAPVDLADVLSGDRVPVTPALGWRTDGVPLIYRGKEHAVAGEPESGKTWFALLIVKDLLQRGMRVVYVDFEDDESTVVGRLLDLGILKQRLNPGQFRYIRPEGKPLSGDLVGLMTFPTGVADLVVYDGWTEGAALLGLDVMSQDDTAKWRLALIRPALKLGVATLTTDHVVKDRENRGRYGIGAQHKLAGLTGVMFLMEVTSTWGRGSKGRSRVLVSKDRNGGLRPHGKPHAANVTHIGDLVGDATSGEMASLLMWPPFEGAQPGDGPPKELAGTIEQIGKCLEGREDPLNFTQIKSRVKGKDNTLREALAWLEDAKWITTEDGPHRSVLHTWVGQPEVLEPAGNEGE
jgi:hypothetical protein